MHLLSEYIFRPCKKLLGPTEKIMFLTYLKCGTTILQNHRINCTHVQVKSCVVNLFSSVFQGNN